MSENSSEPEPVEHFSPSQLSDYQKCPKMYELKRIKKVPMPPAWWLIGGSAVHMATEVLDLGHTDDPEEAYTNALQDAYDEEFRRWPDEDTWVKMGKQNWEYWQKQGLEYVTRWLQWRQDSSWELLSVEYNASCTLADENSIECYVDRLFRDPRSGTHWVVDIKTGSRQPDNSQQLGIYSATAFAEWIKPKAGYWMAKDGLLHEKDVSHYDLGLVMKLGAYLRSAVKAESYLPHVTNECYVCPVKRACYAYSGDTRDSRQYDPLHPRYDRGKTE